MNKQKVVAIIQARMGSTRLPGKVLIEAGGHPVLKHVAERTARCQRLDDVVVATSRGKSDDPIAEFCRGEKIACYRGDEDDVLDRYYHAAKEADSDVVVRLTGDCPLIDPQVIMKAVDLYLSGSFDYVSNIFPSTYPDGLDVEVISMTALETAWREAVQPFDREHVTCFVSENKDRTRFRIGNIENDRDLSHYRLTVDRLRDVELVRIIFDHFGNNNFTMDEIVAFLDDHPEYLAINADIERDEACKEHYLNQRSQL